MRRRRWFLLSQEEEWKEAPGSGKGPEEGLGHAEGEAESPQDAGISNTCSSQLLLPGRACSALGC